MNKHCTSKNTRERRALEKKRRVTKKDEERLAALIETERAAREAGFAVLAGADEVGKGSLAGPVMAACVVMPEAPLIAGVFDSKAFSENKRTRLFEEIQEIALAIGIGASDPVDIDRLGIDVATQNAFALSIQAACRALGAPPDYLFLDTFRFTENFARSLPCSYKALVRADQHVYSVAAASIVAKVTRDRMMRDLAAEYPGYGFETNKGYGTRAHREAIIKLGPSPVHRASFLRNIEAWEKKLGI